MLGSPPSPRESFPQLWKRLWKTGTNWPLRTGERRFSGLYTGRNAAKAVNDAFRAGHRCKGRVTGISGEGESLKRPIHAAFLSSSATQFAVEGPELDHVRHLDLG